MQQGAHTPKHNSTQAPAGRTLQAASRYCFTAGAAMAAQLDAIMAERGGSRADTLRMLVHMGMQEYTTNRAAGITTRQQTRQQATRRRAEAEALQRRREAAQQRKEGQQAQPPAVAPILIDDV